MRAEVPCRIEYLDGILCLLDCLCAGVALEIKDHILTAVNEAFTNVVQHSALGEGDLVEMHAERDANRVLCRMIDAGVPYQAAFEAEHRLEGPATNRMGLFLIRKMMSEVTYERRGRNVLSMVKYIKPEGPRP